MFPPAAHPPPTFSSNVLNLMGINDSTFGNPAYCTGALDLS